MPVRLASLSERIPAPQLLSTRTRRIVFLSLAVVLFLVAFTYHAALMLIRTPASATTEFLYGIAVIGCYGILFTMLSQYFERRTRTPLQIFWRALLTGTFLIVAAWLLASQGGAAALDPDARIALNLSTVLRMNVLSLFAALFAFILLFGVRELLLFKRTKGSVRNWKILLGLMFVAAVSTFMAGAEGARNGLWLFFTVLAVVLMVVNALRLSWIVYLSFREKLITSGLCLALLLVLLFTSTGLLGRGPFASLNHLALLMPVYSYPLYLFSGLSVGFGFLYTFFTFLSLLFHLPTTGDFQKKAGEMAAMHSFSRLVGQVLQPDQLVSSIAASPVEAGSAQAAWLALIDPKSGSLRPHVVAAQTLTLARVAALFDTHALCDDALARRQPLLLNQAAADHRVRAQPGDGIGSVLVVPLIVRDVGIGALFVTKEVSRGFEADDVEMITTFADQAALALENARLFEERIERERLAQELAIARDVQQKLLPQRLPVFEQLSLAASSISAQEVGGDYYDFVDLGDGRFAVIIADVAGKGTSAAFYMAELQGVFQAVSRIAPAPTDFLSHANNALAHTLARKAFISVIYGVVDVNRGEFVFARAGHCPIATTNAEGAARYLRTQGLGLGLDRSELFRKTLVEERVPLQPGDAFVLYTDGIVESRNSAGDEYGYERFIEALNRYRHLPADALHTALLDDLKLFIGSEPLVDDTTLVVLKWHGVPAGTDAGRFPPPEEHAAESERYAF